MRLTKHAEGSIKELWAITLPLMISSLSVVSMFFVDRILLANYSIPALNAAVNASTQGWAFVYGWVILASIAEVFVAQYNGANEKHKLGEPVWQMIWLSLGSLLFFMPMAFWGTYFFYGNSPITIHEREYFYWMMLFGPSYPLYGALAGFFIGQGKTRLVTCLAVAANFVNALLDYLMIFGFQDWIPSMGVAGAAIATSCSSVFQMAVLLIIFLRKKNRTECGTNHYAFNASLFWKCMQVGVPTSLFMVIEIEAWAIFYWMMTSMGERYITVVGICQSVVILMYFFADAVNKATATLVGNFIGAGTPKYVNALILSGIKLHILFFLFLLGGYLLFADQILMQFLSNVDAATYKDLEGALKFFLICDLFYILFEGIRLAFIGALTASGDTKFMFFTGITSVWIFLVLPIYFIILNWGFPVETAGLVCVFYSISACLICGFRFYSGKWKEIHLIKEATAL